MAHAAGVEGGGRQPGAGEQTFVGVDNYAALADDPQLPSVLGATAVFCGGVVVLNIGLGLLFAVLLNRRFRGATFFRSVFFSPVVVSVVAWTLVWGFLLQDNGGVNGVLGAVGIDGPNWLQRGDTAMLSVIVTQVVRSVGVNMVLFLAALQGVPTQLYEAAPLDGAGSVVPTVWMVAASVKPLPEIFKAPPSLWTADPTLSAYREAFSFQPFARQYANSVYIAVLVTLIPLLVSSLAGYAFARIRFPGSNALFLVVLVGLLVPSEATIVPLFQMFRRAGVINTHWPLILVTALAGPCVLATFIMRQFFIALPAELEEAGRLDGLGRPALWWRIFLPPARPALSTVAILTFLTSWNLYLEPTVYLTSPELFTLPQAPDPVRRLLRGRDVEHPTGGRHDDRPAGPGRLRHRPAPARRGPGPLGPQMRPERPLLAHRARTPGAGPPVPHMKSFPAAPEADAWRSTGRHPSPTQSPI